MIFTADMAKSEEEIESDLSDVIGSMAISGFTLSDKTIEDCRAILRGELDCETRVAEIIEAIKKEGRDA